MSIMTRISISLVCVVVGAALTAIPALPAPTGPEGDVVDPILMADLFEGDIMISKDSHPTAWNSRRDPKYRWKNGKIPFHISKDFDGLVSARRSGKRIVRRSYDKRSRSLSIETFINKAE